MQICLVAHRFPPFAGAGVLRPLKFTKYLSRMGMGITVVTADMLSPHHDEDLLREVPETVRVVRVPMSGPFPALSRMRPGPESRGIARARDRVILGLLQLIHHASVPDRHSGFIGEAARAAERAPVSGSDVVLATGGPWSSFVAGDRIARRLHVPLVLDYRDPWTTAPAGWHKDIGALARARNLSLEKRLLSRASAVIVTHERLLEDLARIGPPGLRERCHWIPNGFDPEDFEGLDQVHDSEPGGAFSLTYAGTLYGGRDLTPLRHALEGLVASGEAEPKSIRLRILGPHGEQFRRRSGGSPLLAQIEALGMVSHRQALSSMISSTINILTDIEYSGPNMHTPGKLYEYLRARRPILALTPAGVTAEIIRRTGAGWVVPPDDADGIRAVLSDAYRTWRAGGQLPSAREEELKRYDRAHQARQLASVLQGLLSSSGSERQAGVTR